MAKPLERVQCVFNEGPKDGDIESLNLPLPEKVFRKRPVQGQEMIFEYRLCHGSQDDVTVIPHYHYMGSSVVMPDEPEPQDGA